MNQIMKVLCHKGYVNPNDSSSIRNHKKFYAGWCEGEFVWIVNRINMSTHIYKVWADGGVSDDFVLLRPGFIFL